MATKKAPRCVAAITRRRIALKHKKYLEAPAWGHRGVGKSVKRK